MSLALCSLGLVQVQIQRSLPRDGHGRIYVDGKSVIDVEDGQSVLLSHFNVRLGGCVTSAKRVVGRRLLFCHLQRYEWLRLPPPMRTLALHMRMSPRQTDRLDRPKKIQKNADTARL